MQSAALPPMLVTTPAQAGLQTFIYLAENRSSIPCFTMDSCGELTCRKPASEATPNVPIRTMTELANI